MKVESGRGRWCSGVDEVVVGCAHAKHEGGVKGGVWAKTCNQAALALLRVHCVKQQWCMVHGAWGWRGGTYQAVVVVGLLGCKTWRGSRFGWKTRNRAAVAWFLARCVEREWGMLCGGGTVACTRWWWWWWGCVVAKHKEERGVWVKNQKRSRRGSVSGCNGAAGGGRGCCGVTAPPSRWYASSEYTNEI